MIQVVANAAKRYRENVILVDSALCIGLMLLYGYLLAEFDGFEAVYAFTRAHEEWELDEILGILLTAPLFITIFAYKRIVQLKNEIAARKKAEEELQVLALMDPLTELPNRRYLDEEINRRVARCARHGGGIALLHLDLDRFKQINDTLGHTAGDDILKKVADLLRENTRQNDFVARIGGDEFVIISEIDKRLGEVGALASKIVDKLKEPINCRGALCRLGGSIGIGLDPGGGRQNAVDPQRLLINADIALCRAKELGGGRYEFSSMEMQQEFEHDKRLSDEILGGLDRDEFFPVYQLQFDARTLDVVGVEALARWRHPNGEVLAPSEFLAAANRLGITGKIDHLMLEKALGDLRDWSAAGLTIPKVAVNVSMQRLQDDGLIKELMTLRVPANTLTLELNESIFLDEYSEVVRDNLEKIKALGVGIEIDDFGTGHASIVALTRLMPAQIKIDRELIIPIVSSANQRMLVRTLVDMAKSIGVSVVAEGVETAEHVAVLGEIGCDTFQGYGLARPMPAEEVPVFVAREAWRAAVRGEPSKTFASANAPTSMAVANGGTGP